MYVYKCNNNIKARDKNIYVLIKNHKRIKCCKKMYGSNSIYGQDNIRISIYLYMIYILIYTLFMYLLKFNNVVHYERMFMPSYRFIDVRLNG